MNGLDIMTVSVPAFPCTVGDPDVVLPPVAGAENIDGTPMLTQATRFLGMYVERAVGMCYSFEDMFLI